MERGSEAFDPTFDEPSPGDSAYASEYSDPAYDDLGYEELYQRSGSRGAYMSEDDEGIKSGGGSSFRSGKATLRDSEVGCPDGMSGWAAPTVNCFAAESETTVQMSILGVGSAPEVSSEFCPSPSPSWARSVSPPAAAARRAEFFQRHHRAHSLEESSVIDSWSAGAGPGSESDADSGRAAAADGCPAVAAAEEWPGAAFSGVSVRVIPPRLPRLQLLPASGKRTAPPKLASPGLALYTAISVVERANAECDSDSVGSCDSDGVAYGVSGFVSSPGNLTYVGNVGVFLRRDTEFVPV